MGKISGVTETTVYSVMTPLEHIEDKGQWAEQIYRQASFAANALNTDLKIGIDIVQNFEKNRAWEYMQQDRETFYRFCLNIDPASLPKILEGYKVLAAQGLTPTHWRQAVDAVKPLIKTNQGRPKKDNSYGANIKAAGTSATYYIARIKRDRPDIAERLANGEFRSVAAAAKAAGIKIKDSRAKPLINLRYWWRKCSNEQRQSFLTEIGAEITKSPPA
jgi:hypothetical protein